MASTPRLCTHQPEPQQEDFIPLPRTFDRLHQPANLSDALFVALCWLDAAGSFNGVHSVSSRGAGNAANAE